MKNTIATNWRAFADEQECKTWMHRCLKILLYPFGFIYALCARAKNSAYDKKILKPFTQKGIHVISIGNLSLGGTGKTPLTILIANALVGKGAVLSRGYGRQSKKPLLIHQDNYHRYHPKETGDEPYLIAKKTKASVFINSNREEALKEAHALGCTWALLDDGFQRRKTHRNFDIVVIGPTLFGNGLCFPAGPLREPPSSLKRADAIVLIGHDSEEEIRQYSNAPIIKAKWHPVSLSSDTECSPLDRGEKVGLFCGIGNPSLFIETVQEAGISITSTFIAPDHQVPSFKELSTFWALCDKQGAAKLICTEKDYVKLDKLTKSTLPVFYVESELQITQREELFTSF